MLSCLQGKVVGRENAVEVKQKWRFAFIVHPRNLDEILLKYPLLRSLPRDRVAAILKRMRPFPVSPIVRFKESDAEELGWLLATPLTPDLMEKDPDLARRKIHDAVEIAQQSGANLVGLGGWNASLSHHGRDLSHSQIAVTTGLTMTVATILSDIAEIFRWKGILMREATVAVVGSGGAVGRAARLQLQGKVKRLLSLSAQQKERSCIQEVDLVLVATRAMGPVLDPEDLKKGAIIYDVSQPSNVPSDLCAARPDIVALQGGLVRTPGIDYGPFLGLPPETAFACLAETVLLSLEGKLPKSPQGAISPVRVREMPERAKRYGFISAMKLGGKA